MTDDGGGAGETRSVSTGDLVVYLRNELLNDGREPESINVQYLTEGLYGVQLLVRGELEPEAFFIKVQDEPGSAEIDRNV